MRNLTDKEAVELLDRLDQESLGSHFEADNILMAALRGAGLAKVAEAYEAARDRVGFWYS